jgi:hypothetical protein
VIHRLDKIELRALLVARHLHIGEILNLLLRVADDVRDQRPLIDGGQEPGAPAEIVASRR